MVMVRACSDSPFDFITYKTVPLQGFLVYRKEVVTDFKIHITDAQVHDIRMSFSFLICPLSLKSSSSLMASS